MTSLVNYEPSFKSYLWGGRKYMTKHEKTRKMVRDVASNFKGAIFIVEDEGLSPFKLIGNGYKISILTGETEQCGGKVQFRKDIRSKLYNNYHLTFNKKLKKAPASA